MRVAMLVWSYWPGHEGGAERQCRKIIEQATDKDVEFLVLTSRYSFKALAEEYSGNSRILRFGVLAPLENSCRRGMEWLVSRSVTLCSISSAERYHHWIHAIQFWSLLPLVWNSRIFFILELFWWFVRNHESVQVVHVHESDWLAGVAQYLGCRWRIPVLSKTATANVLPRIGYDVPLRRKWNMKRIKGHFICQHRGQLDDLIACGVDESRIFLLPNGVEIPAERAHPEKWVGRVLYVGNFTQGAHWKAFDVLIKAWAQVHERLPEAVLVMVGGGNSQPWKRLAETYGCLESIVFQGAVSTVSPHYLQAAMFILPSRVEGLSNALLEAQSYGLPCVVSDIPGNRAVVEDGYNGVVVPPDDPEALSEAIISLALNDDRRLLMGESARARIVSDFSMESTVNKLLQIYSQLVDSES